MALFYRWVAEGESSPLGRWVYYLSVGIVLASVVMAGISMTQLDVYCLFCITAYVLSIISLWGYYQGIEGTGFSYFLVDFMALPSKQMGLLVGLAMIPFGAWITNGLLYDQYRVSSQQFEQVVNRSLQEWKSSKTYSELEQAEGLVIGPAADEAKMTLVEFADFRCGHCRSAAPKLHAFAKANPDVRFVFMVFPLDGACNPAIPRSTGLSCRLAKAAFCAPADKAWTAHDWIFDHQPEYRSMAIVDEKLKEMSSELGFSWDELVKCIDSRETAEKIEKQAKLGQAVNVQGTPSIFANGRSLPGGQFIQVLKAALDASQ